MATTISFYNSKGGVSKTISAANVGASLKSLGYKVLLIDLDPQANLSQHFGKEESPCSLYEVILEGANVLNSIEPIVDCLDMIPSNDSLYPLDYHLHSINDKEFILRKLKEKHLDLQYDFVIIDCPAFFNLLTINALSTADYNLIPCSADCFSLNGIRQLLEMIGEIKKQLRFPLKQAGLFLTQVESDDPIYLATIRLIKLYYPKLYLGTDIRRDVDLAKAPIYALDIFRYQPNSHGAEDYQKLTLTLLDRLGKTMRAHG
jgi:chromosome partitioning protein